MSRSSHRAALLSLVLLLPAGSVSRAADTGPPEPASDPVERALELRRRGRSDPAAHILEQAGRRGRPEAWFHLGRLRLDQGQVEDAIDALLRAVDAAPGEPTYHLVLGDAYIRRLDRVGAMGKLFTSRKARASFARAVELAPERLDVREALARYYLRAPAIAGGGEKKAWGQVQALEELDPAAGLRLRARLLQEKGEAEAARRVLEEGTRDHAGSAPLLVDLGVLHQRSEAWEDALEAFEQALDAAPGHPLALYQVGRTGALSGEHLDRAEAALRRYLEESPEGRGLPSRAYALWRLGLVLEHQGRVLEAADLYRRALEETPDLEEARRRLHDLGAVSSEEAPATRPGG